MFTNLAIVNGGPTVCIYIYIYLVGGLQPAYLILLQDAAPSYKLVYKPQ